MPERSISSHAGTPRWPSLGIFSSLTVPLKGEGGAHSDRLNSVNTALNRGQNPERKTMTVKTFAGYTAVFCAGAIVFAAVGVLSGVFPAGREDAMPASQTPAAMQPQSSPGIQNDGGNDAASPAQETSPLTTDGVTPISELQRNTTVVIQGTVERVTEEDEFFLTDSTGSVEVWTGNSFFVVEPGENITVRGFVDDDMFLEIYAQEIVRSDGSVVTINLSGN